MGKKNMNFVRISRLISNVGANVLRRLLEETAQTLFFNDLENVWQKQVQEIKNTNYAAKLWGSFIKDISRADKTFRESFKPLLMSWKVSTKQVLTCPEEKSMLEKWRDAIDGLKRSGSSEITELCLSWLREIEKRLKTIDIISGYLNQWTTELRTLCQTSRQDLLKILKQHYDDFVTSSSEEFKNWNSLSRMNLESAINDLEGKRKKMQTHWKIQSKTYFEKVEGKFEERLRSWKTDSQRYITIIPELNQLFDAFEAEIITIDDKKLQKSCDLWHDKLSNLFESWFNEIEQRDTDKRSRLLKTSAEKELSCFHSIGSVCVKETLTEHLSKEQLSKLVPSSDISNLRAYGTTFLIIFFRNYLVYPPMQGWNEVPAKSDLSFGADIIRLLFFGKDIIAHTEKFRIGHHTFDKLWSDITEVLVRLASQSGDDFKSDVRNEVDKIKRRPSFDEKKELVRILEFCERTELYERVEPPIYETLMPSINSVKILKRVKSHLRQERSHISSDEESSSDSGSSSGTSDTGSSDSSRD